jgi:hypothetical protein
MSFADLKKQSKFGFDTLTKEIEKLQNPTTSDDRLWKPELDKSGNGYAVIRFLPAAEGDELPFVKSYTHGFQGPGGWFIENCPTTIDGNCPVCEENRRLWATKTKENENIARDRKRKLSYYSNIYVVTDSANPSNEGKVFLFKYGKKIFDKLMSAMKPEYADEVAINPFDFWEGANFKLKIKKVAGYWNYDDSSFAAPGVLANFDDKQLETIWRSEHSLADYHSPSNFKTYEELQTRLNVSLDRQKTARVDRETYEDEEETFSAPTRSSFTEMNTSTSYSGPAFATATASTSKTDDEDDGLGYFARLAEED